MKCLNLLATSILLATLISGCTFTHNLKVEPKLESLPQPPVNPLHAGVYYSPDFSTQEHSRTSGENIWVVPIGAASVRLFDNILPRVFEKVDKISQLPDGTFNTKEVDVVIVPAIEHFDFRLGLNSDTEQYSISYRVTLYSRRGIPAASWIVHGNATKSRTSIDQWVEDDMNDAAAKFLRDFQNNAGAALSAITNHTDKRPNTINPKHINLSAKLLEPSGLNEQQATAFKNAGVVIYQVTIRNNGEQPLLARGSDMRLRLKNGQIIEPSSVSSTINTLEQTSHAGGVVAGLFGSPFGVLVTLSQSNSNSAKRDQLLRTIGGTLFQEQTLNNGQLESGSVLFRLPKGVKVDEVATLTAWMIDPPNADGAQIEISLP